MRDNEYYVMTWCNICYDWKLHKPSKDLDDKTITCIDCKTINEGYILDEIPPEKIEEQQKRYVNNNTKSIIDIYDRLLTNSFSGLEDTRIIYDDAGYKAKKKKEKYFKIEEMKKLVHYFTRIPKDQQRNHKCHCGSGIKYKKCCREKDKEIEKKIRLNYHFCKENNIIK